MKINKLQAGEDIAIGDVIALSDHDGQIYRSDPSKKGVVVAIALRDIKKGEIIELPESGHTEDVIVSGRLDI